MRIFLLGYMGVGKSTLGQMAADLLSVEFVDFDSLVEAHCQMTISEIFSQFGETFFRKLEHELLREVIQTRDQFIMGTGGGLPCFNNNLQIMNENGYTIYLRASSDSIVERLSLSAGSRPLILNKSPAELYDFVTAMLLEREPIYQQSKATVELDLSLPKQQNVERLLSILKKVL